MVRRYDIEGSRNLLWWGIGLALLCAWCVRDGWFPTPSKQEQHIHYTAFQDEKGQWVSASEVRREVSGSWRDGANRAMKPVKLNHEDVDRDRLVLRDADSVSVLEEPDSFYFLFNKSIAILSAIGSLLCLLVYKLNP